MSKATDVMTRMIDKAIELCKEFDLSAEELNDGGWDSALTVAFDLINHEPFKNREALSKVHTKEIEASEEKMRERFSKITKEGL